MGILAVLILSIGLFPNALMDGFIIPAARSAGFDGYFIDRYLVGMDFFNIKDLSSTVQVYAGGILIYVVGMKLHLFHLHLPKQLDFESDYYTPIYEWSGKTFDKGIQKMERFIGDSDVFIYSVMLLLMIVLLLNFF